MRDGATGRSRGFGFLTFKDPKTVNTVMVKEHYLDGKIVRVAHHFSETSPETWANPNPNARRSHGRKKNTRLQKQIDPKRAIPKDEQEKTAKIFVGGVSQDATEADFTDFFEQFGRVIDATLMMDKDTGRPRGFGFVTFDNDAAVERVLAHFPLEILNKPIEVKRAQPRGKMGEEEEFRGGRGRGGKFGRDDRFGNDGGNNGNNQNQGPNMQGMNGMSPQMMAQ
jgi:RNA-binding protein Musashi